MLGAPSQSLPPARPARSPRRLHLLGRDSCPSAFLWALPPVKGQGPLPSQRFSAGLWRPRLHCLEFWPAAAVLAEPNSCDGAGRTVQGQLLLLLQRKSGPLLSEGSKLAGCQRMLHRPRIKGAQPGRERIVFTVTDPPMFPMPSSPTPGSSHQQSQPTGTG